MKFNPGEYDPQIGIFSMGACLNVDEPYLPTYSGGLEVLTGDILHSCADLRIPVVGIIQSSSSGYFKQEIDENGWQREKPTHWVPDLSLERIDETVTIKHKGRDLIVGASPYKIVGETDFKIPVYLLDTNFQENNLEDREITGMLYDNDPEHRIAQENVLGQAGVKLLRKLSYDIKKFHMNEGHAAFATLELLAEGKTEKEIKNLCAFTTHTPVAAGHDKWDYNSVRNIVGDFLPKNIRELAGQYDLNMTQLVLNLSGYFNAVSKKHAEVCKEMEVFKGREIDYITNGIHPKNWATKPFADLFESHFKYWSIQPRVFGNIDHISTNEILEAKADAKRHLICYINSNNPVKFDNKALTIVWARRFTGYKRPLLLFKDKDRLHKLAEKLPLQIIYAGKSHPADIEGKELIKEVFELSKAIQNNIRVVFLENYNTEMAKILLGGADVWLNTPRRPLEASGTSGMKAALNGCLNLSSYDGWICEGYEMSPKAIWLVGPKSNQVTINQNWQEEDRIDAESLYDNLEDIIEVYKSEDKSGNKQELGKRMAESIRLISYFNTHRIVREYATKAWDIKP